MVVVVAMVVIKEGQGEVVMMEDKTLTQGQVQHPRRHPVLRHRTTQFQPG